MRRLLPAAVAGLAVIALLVWAFVPRAITVETASIDRRPLTVTIEAEGEARIREVVTVSAPMTGRLRRIALHAGDVVAAGQAVALIGPAAPALLDERARAVAEATAAAADAAVDLARAQVGQAEATLDYATTESARAQALFTRGALSRRLLDSAVLAERTAQAALTSARANLAVREREVESTRAVLAAGTGAVDAQCCTRIVTPVAGRVLRVLTEDEQVVQAGTPIVEIGDPADIKIVADVLSRDAVRMVAGAEATLAGWGGPDLAAHVERIEPAAVTRVSALGIEEQRVEVVLALAAPPPPALGHGFRVVVRITVWQGQDVLAIPVGALFRSGADWATFVVGDGRVAERRIRIGERNEDHAEVLDGLADGEVVIVHPGDTVATGVRVKTDPAEGKGTTP